MPDFRANYTPDKVKAVRKLFDQDCEAWAEIRKEADLDIKCIDTEQGPWPDAEWNARHIAGNERPCLHEDVLTQYVNQVANQIEMNPMGVEATPAGNGATEETAQLVENRIRQIEYEERGPLAYIHAARCAIRSSYGAFVLESARFRAGLKVCIEPVMDPATIVPGFSRKPDWSDMRRCWQLERMSHEEFRSRFPKAAIQNFEEYSAVAPKWVDNTSVQIAAWWHIEEDERELLHIDTPEGRIRAYADEFENGTRELEGEIAERRTVQSKKVLKTLFNGVEALDETEWVDPGDPDYDIDPEIPVFIVNGQVKYLKGKRQIESLVRKGRIGQLLYDSCISAIQEAISKIPKANAWGPEGSFDTSTDWLAMGRSPVAYYEWKPVQGPNGETLPKPDFIQFEPALQALEIAKQSILIGIQNAIGLSSTERKDRAAKSGKALEQLQQDMSINTAHYFASLRIAQERMYRVLQRVLPVIDQVGSEISVRDKFGKPNQATVSQEMYQARHAVAVGTGKLYQTLQEKQEQTATELMGIKDEAVLLAVLPGALRMKGIGEFGDQLADMIESIQPAPMQQARQSRQSGAKTDPAALQAVQQARQQLEALNAHAKQLEQRVIELEDEQRAKVIENEAKLQLAREDNAAKVAIAEINASVKMDIENLKSDIAAIKHIADVMSNQAQLTHEDQQNSLQRQHEATESERDRQTAAEQAEQDRLVQVTESQAQRDHDAQMATEGATE